MIKYYIGLYYLSTKLLYFDSKMIHHIAGLIKLTNYIHHINHLSIINLFNRADIQSKVFFFRTKLYRNVQSIKYGGLLSHDPITCVSLIINYRSQYLLFFFLFLARIAARAAVVDETNWNLMLLQEDDKSWKRYQTILRYHMYILRIPSNPFNKLPTVSAGICGAGTNILRKLLLLQTYTL